MELGHSKNVRRDSSHVSICLVWWFWVVCVVGCFALHSISGCSEAECAFSVVLLVLVWLVGKDAIVALLVFVQWVDIKILLIG